jgi:two-component system, OmpR family, sensor kinase
MSDRRLDYAFLACAGLCLLVMAVSHELQMVAFHVLWLGLSLVFGLRLWARRGTALALAFVVLSTAAVMILTGQLGDDPSELADIPLMAAIFLALVWHARRHEQMREALAEAQEHERVFMRNAVHGLRTPVTVAYGHAELVREQLPGGSRACDNLGVVLDELRRLSRASDRLLTLVVSDHDAFLARSAVDPAELVEAVARRWSVATGRRVEAYAEHGPAIAGDPERLCEALDALVENALRASALSEPVTLTLRREGDMVAIEVRDRGLGISRDGIARLFEPFSRPNGHGARGTGLGLAIVRAIAEGHGGGVEARSVPGQGSVFTMRLGAGQPPAPVPVPAPTPRLAAQHR